MGKAKLGTKRSCNSCGARFYDLNRDPIICPKCENVFVPFVAKTKPEKAATKVDDKDPEEVKTADTPTGAEFVSLEEADSEDADTGAVKITSLDDDDENDTSDDEDIDVNVDIDIDDDLGGDTETFLEDEDDDDGVESIIVSKDDEEDT